MSWKIFYTTVKGGISGSEEEVWAGCETHTKLKQSGQVTWTGGFWV